MPGHARPGQDLLSLGPCPPSAEIVEQRIDHDRHHDSDHERKRQEQEAGVEPPALGAFTQQEVQHPQQQPAGDDVHAEALERMREPAAERLIRQSVGVRPEKPLVVVERPVDQVVEHREHQIVDTDDEVPAPAKAFGPGSQSRRQPCHQKQAGDQQAPELVHDPDDIAAAIALQRQLTWLWNRDPVLGHGIRACGADDRGREQ